MLVAHVLVWTLWRFLYPPQVTIAGCLTSPQLKVIDKELNVEQWSKLNISDGSSWSSMHHLDHTMEELTVCGGWEAPTSSHCWTFQQGVWNMTSTLKHPRLVIGHMCMCNVSNGTYPIYFFLGVCTAVGPLHPALSSWEDMIAPGQQRNWTQMPLLLTAFPYNMMQCNALH